MNARARTTLQEVRIPDADLARIDRAADADGRTRSDWIRRAVVRAAEGTMTQTAPYIDGDVIIPDTLESARAACVAADQRSRLGIGARTWAITYQPGGQRGQMSQWGDSGAIMLGGDSSYGEWRDAGLVCDDGVTYTAGGEEVTEEGR